MDNEQAQAGITDEDVLKLERELVLEVVRVTEEAAIAASRVAGKGDSDLVDQAGTDAMRRVLNDLDIDGEIVIGEGERDEAPMLYIGETVGAGDGPQVDIAVDPLEGTTLCAKNQPDSICVLAMAERGGLLNAPDVYMHKIAIGAGYPAGTVDLDRSPTENATALAAAKGVPLREITACVLDRPRHAALIEELRNCGIALKLISDGDIAGIIHATNTEETGIDLYIGRRPRGRPCRRRLALHRRPDAGAADSRQRGQTGARPPHGHRRPEPHLRRE